LTKKEGTGHQDSRRRERQVKKIKSQKQEKRKRGNYITRRIERKVSLKISILNYVDGD
jgi:hypothetical protein